MSKINPNEIYEYNNMYTCKKKAYVNKNGIYTYKFYKDIKLKMFQKKLNSASTGFDETFNKYFKKTGKFINQEYGLTKAL